MGKKMQHPESARLLGGRIDAARRERRLTLKQLSESTGVDKGQLSRFCKGQFKTWSTNLQIVIAELQMSDGNVGERAASEAIAPSAPPIQLLEHVAESWRRAGGKREAYANAIYAIERLLL